MKKGWNRNDRFHDAALFLDVFSWMDIAAGGMVSDRAPLGPNGASVFNKITLGKRMVLIFRIILSVL